MQVGTTINLGNSVAKANSASPLIQRDIERVDARDFREEIIALFEGNRNSQFAQQFDWYYRDRGQQTPIAWLLRDRKRRIVGLCSVTLRTLRYGSTAVRAGVAGNLVMDRSCGAYLGPFSLVNAMKSLIADGEIDILLGIPNELAQPLFSRSGFHAIDRWTTHVQISKSRDLLNFYFGRPGKAASRLVDLGAAAKRSLSHWAQARCSCFRVVDLPELELHTVRFEEWPSLWHRFQNRVTSEYLAWRFLRFPVQEFSIVAIVTPQYEVCGYLVLRRSPGRIWIAECGVDHRRLSETDAILCFCHDPRALDSTVWIPTLSSGSLPQELSGCGFATMPHGMGGYPDFSLVAYWRPDHPLAGAFAQSTSWHLFSGFNDV